MQKAQEGYSHKNLVKYNVAEMPRAQQQFLEATFRLMKRNKSHEIAAAFTFGREDLIPDLFTEIVKDLDQKVPGKLSAFIYYLERHIEIDGDEHGPMALKMIRSLCGNNQQKWQEAGNAAVEALQARLEFWDAINAQVQSEKSKETLSLT